MVRGLVSSNTVRLGGLGLKRGQANGLTRQRNSIIESATGAWRAATSDTSGLRLLDLTGQGRHMLFGGNGVTPTTNDPKLLKPDNGTPYVYLASTAGNFISVENSGAGTPLDILGDFDLRVAVALEDYSTGAFHYFISKDGFTSGGYYLRIQSGGALQVSWHDGTTVHSQLSTTSIYTEHPGFSDGDLILIRATLDADNGAGGYDVTFWSKTASTPATAHADLLDDTDWNQWGTVIVGGAPTSVASRTSLVQIGARSSQDHPTGKFYAAVVKDGIGGTAVLDLDFTTGVQDIPTSGVLASATGAWRAADVTGNGRSLLDLTGNDRNMDFGGNATTATSNDPKALSHDGTNYVYLSGVAGNYVSVPDSSALDVTDLDVTFDVALDDWVSGSALYLGSKWVAAGNQRSWNLYIASNGELRLQWSTDGSAIFEAQSTATIDPADGTRHTVRVTFDVDNGAGGRDIKFYVDGVQLGATVTQAGTTSIFNSTASVTFAGINSGALSVVGKFYGVTVKDGIGGTTVLDLDFTSATQTVTTPASLATATGAWRAGDLATNGRRLVDLTGQGRDMRFGGNGTAATTNDPKALEFDGTRYLYVPGTAGNYGSVPDGAPIDINGDIDITVDVALDSWATGALQSMVDKIAGVNGYALRVNTTGALYLLWGDGSTQYSSTSTANVSDVVAAGERCTIRCTMDVDNGAAGRDITFYVNGVQLGDVTTQAGTTAIGNSSAGLGFGLAPTPQNAGAPGKYYGVVVKDGIGGTTVLDIDFTSATQFPSGGASTTGTAATGQTVSINRSTSGRKSVLVDKPTLLLGTDDFLSIADDDAFDITTPSTAVFVARRWHDPGSNQSYFAHGKSPGDSNKGWVLYGGGGNAALNEYDTSNAYTTIAGPMTAGTLHTLALPLDAGNLTAGGTIRIGANGQVTAGGFADIEVIGAAIFVGQVLTAGEIAQVGADLTASTSAAAPEGYDTNGTELAQGGVIATINRSATGRKSAVVRQPVLLLGLDDFLSAPDDPVFDLGAGDDLTVVAVVRQWGAPFTFSRFVDKQSGTANAKGWRLLNQDTNRRPYLYVGDGTVATSTSGALVSYGDGERATVAAVLNRTADTAHNYTSTDGMSSSTTDITTAGSENALGLYIGRNAGGPSNYLDAEIYGVAIFKGRVLTTAEIEQAAAELAAAQSNTAPDGFNKTHTEFVQGSTVATVGRSATGRKTVVVDRPVLLLGTDDYLSTPDNDVFDVGADDDLTVVAVLRKFGGNTDEGPAIVSKRSNTTPTVGAPGWVVLANTAESVFMRIDDGTDEDSAQTGSGSYLANGTLDVIYGTLDGATIGINAAGATGSAVRSAGDLSTSEPVRIGSTVANHLHGEVYGVAVFVGRVLTEAEIIEVATVLRA